MALKKLLAALKVPPSKARKRWLKPQHDTDLAESVSFSNPDFIIGLDEVGRGCLAGPVFASAFCYSFARLPDFKATYKTLKVTDSKILDQEERAAAEKILVNATDHFHFELAQATNQEIDEINIHNASLLAMYRALEGVLYRISNVQEPHTARILFLIDGIFAPKDLKASAEVAAGTWKIHTLVQGDSKSFAIASAAILAKEARDRFMRKLAAIYPDYSWDTNVGYGTPEHRRALYRLGQTSWHRRSFNWQVPEEITNLVD